MDVTEAVAPDPAGPVSPPGGVTAGPGWHWLTPAVEMAARESGNWPLARERVPWRWSSLPRVATRTAVPGPAGVRAARDFAAATLARWGVTERCDDIVVVISELLTNAFRHAVPAPESGAGDPRRWPVRVALLQPGPCVLCAVSDPSDREPAPRQPGWLEETGRGLHVVASLSDAWGCALAEPSPPAPAATGGVPAAGGGVPAAAGVAQATPASSAAVPAGALHPAVPAGAQQAAVPAAAAAQPAAAVAVYPTPTPAPAAAAVPGADPAAGFLTAPPPEPGAGLAPFSGDPAPPGGLPAPPGWPQAAAGKVVWAVFATGPASAADPVPAAQPVSWNGGHGDAVSGRPYLVWG